MSKFERSKPVYSLETRADLPGAIVAAIAAGAIGEATLLRALRRGVIAHWQVMPGSSVAEFKRFADACRGRPTVVYLPADDYCDSGPEKWPSARAAFRWAKKIIVHAAGAQIEHYEDAVKVAQIYRHVLLVECSAARAEAWLSLLPSARHKTSPVLIIPFDGHHPILPPAGALQ